MYAKLVFISQKLVYNELTNKIKLNEKTFSKNYLIKTKLKSTHQQEILSNTEEEKRNQKTYQNMTVHPQRASIKH